MSDDIRERARKLFRAPFKYVSGYVWDDDGEMLADNHVDSEAPGATLRVREWGRLGYIAKSPKEAEDLQDAYGELIAEALTEHFGKRTSSVLVAADKLKEFQEERDRLKAELAKMREALKRIAGPCSARRDGSSSCDEPQPWDGKVYDVTSWCWRCIARRAIAAPKRDSRSVRKRPNPAKTGQDLPARESAMFCEHANEVPQACPCPPSCYCRDHTCRYGEA